MNLFGIRVGAALFTVFAVAGCSMVNGIVQSELSSYAEPVDGAIAHLRLIGSRNVKVYPASTCLGTGVVGSGYPAGPQWGGQRRRDLGMPKLVGTPRHFVEIAARSGEPIAMAFEFYRDSTPQHLSSHCYAAGSFVPEAGGQYDVVARWVGGQCSIDVGKLVRTGANVPWQRVRVPSEPASNCSRAAAVDGADAEVSAEVHD